MPLLIPAAALDQPDARYPRRLLFMTPRYWQFYLLVGIAGAVAWRRRPRTPVPVPAPKPPEMAVKPVAFAPVMDADVAWMVGSSVVCQGGRRLTITRLLQKSAGTLVLEAVKPNPGDSPVTVRVLMEERWQQRAMAEHLDQSLRRFRTLTHPNLGKILDWGVIRSPDGASARPFLVGEKMTGESMRALLASGRACTSAEVLQWGADLLKALEQAHKRGFFHGAIQPECITVGPNGRARLVDFGWGADAYDGAYRAPEQRCDAPGDVYSVGVILGEFLPQPPSAVKSVLDRMRARDPAERYPTAEAALDALASL
jgi:serine/threonine protein kinase